MDARLHPVTLATRDLDRARRFCSDGFGWEPQMDVPVEIIFYPVAGLLLGLFGADKFARTRRVRSRPSPEASRSRTTCPARRKSSHSSIGSSTLAGWSSNQRRPARSAGSCTGWCAIRTV